MDKKIIVKTIVEVCKEQNWNFSEKYKQDDWKNRHLDRLWFL